MERGTVRVKCFFGCFFFSYIMPESWGCGLYTSAAYTQVFMVIKVTNTLSATQQKSTVLTNSLSS